MTSTDTHQIGRVIRVGRRWADVLIDQKIRRVSTRPDLLVKPGCYLQIINEQGITMLAPSDRHTSDRLH
jgi:hypothetical protein